MRIKHCCILFCFPVLFCCATASGTLEQRIAVEEAMRRANDYFQASYSPSDHDSGTTIYTDGWERSTYQTGNFRAWETLGVQAWYDRAVAWGEYNEWNHGTDYSDWEGASADAHCCGQTYIDLYNVDPDPVRTNAITTLLDGLLLENQPDSYDDWWWIDAFYMAGSTLARLAVLNDDDAYLDQLAAMYHYMKDTRGLFDSSRGLWWRDGDYVDTDTYWGRGNGWLIASCARILEVLPKDDTICRPEFESMLKTMATALLPWQQSDGFWRSDIINPTNYPNPETSGTAFFTYAIAYGINEGILVDESGANYTAAATNGWNGLVNIALHDDGKLGYTQAVGSYPLAATAESERDYGTGAFLLAGSEILRLLGGPAPAYADAGVDRELKDSDEDYVESVTLSASNSVVRSGSIEMFKWWCGPVLLGTGEVLNVDFPLGTNTVTLTAGHSDETVYTDEVCITVDVPASIEVSASGSQSGNPPGNTLDDDLATRWSQDGNDGSQWIQFDLAEAATFDHVDIACYLGDQRQGRFAIWLSSDGVNFTQVLPDPDAGGPPHEHQYVSSSGLSLEPETFSFPAQSIRSVRIHGWGNSASSWNSVTEVSIPVDAAVDVSDQADADTNGLPDSWEVYYLGSTGHTPSAEIGNSGITLEEAYVFGLDPAAPDASALLGISTISNRAMLSVQTIGAFGVGYQGLTRKYRVLSSGSLTNEAWSAVSACAAVQGNNLPLEIGITNLAPVQFYRVESWVE